MYPRAAVAADWRTDLEAGPGARADAGVREFARQKPSCTRTARPTPERMILRARRHEMALSSCDLPGSLMFGDRGVHRRRTVAQARRASRPEELSYSTSTGASRRHHRAARAADARSTYESPQTDATRARPATCCSTWHFWGAHEPMAVGRALFRVLWRQYRVLHQVDQLQSRSTSATGRRPVVLWRVEPAGRVHARSSITEDESLRDPATTGMQGVSSAS